MLLVLVRAAEVVERDGDFALQAGFALRLQRARVDVHGLRVVAHAVVEDGDGVQHRDRVRRHASFSNSACERRRSARPVAYSPCTPSR